MADDKKTVPAANASGGAGGSPTPPVAKPAPASSPGIAPAGTAGPKSAPKIGEVGYQFLHPVDSPAGQDERREHERLRKASKRDAAKAVAARLVEPAPLSPVNPGVPGQPTPPAGALDAGSPGQTLPAGDPPPVPWQPELLNDLLGELLDAAEEGRVGSFLAKCEEAKLTPKLLKEIEQDAHFPKTAKLILKRSLPRLACKWLNKSGVSAEYQDELAVVTAILLIVQNDRKLSAKLDDFIASQQKAPAPVKPPTPGQQMQPIVLPDPPLPPGAPKPVIA